MNYRRREAVRQARELRRRQLAYANATRRDYVFVIIATVLIVSLINRVVSYTTEKIPTKAFAQVVTTNAVPTPTPVQVAENWGEFIASAQKIAAIYNYPVKLLIAQAAHESNRGLSVYARERNNYFGMGCYDWNPDGNCFYYENQEQGIVDYIINVRRTFPEAWEHRDNPESMLKLLIHNSQNLRYATDPEYVEKVMNTPEWRNY